MSDVLAALLDEFRALDAAATPGPGDRLYAGDLESGQYYVHAPKAGLGAIVCVLSDDEDSSADAAFIARARTLLSELAEQVEWITSRLGALAAVIDEAGDYDGTARILRAIAAGRPVEETR